MQKKGPAKGPEVAEGGGINNASKLVGLCDCSNVWAHGEAWFLCMRLLVLAMNEADGRVESSCRS